MENEGEFRWLSVPEVAERHGVSPQAIHQAIKNGTLQARIVHRTAKLQHHQIREDWYEQWAREIRTPQPRKASRKPPLENIVRREAEAVVV